MIHKLNKSIQRKARSLISTAEMLSLQDKEAVRLPNYCKPMVEKLAKETQELHATVIKYAGCLEPDVNGKRIDQQPSEPGSPGSIIRKASFLDNGICIILDPLPSRSSSIAAQYGRLLRESLRGLPGEIVERVLTYEEVDVTVCRKVLPNQIANTYDMDNGAYSVLLNALQGVLLKSERIEYLRSFTIYGKQACEECLEVNIFCHKKSSEF